MARNQPAPAPEARCRDGAAHPCGGPRGRTAIAPGEPPVSASVRGGEVPARPGARALVAVSLAAALLACPEERPGAAREIPPQRVPPAMSLEAPPATPERGGGTPPGSPPAPSAPSAAAPSPAPSPTPSPAVPARRP